MCVCERECMLGCERSENNHTQNTHASQSHEAPFNIYVHNDSL